MSESAYAGAGVDTDRAGQALAGLVSVLRGIDPGRERRAVLGSGHYANILALDADTGIALSTDGVGSKVIIAEQLGRFDTVGIDCIAMNVNDIICVGAEPLALLDYIAVEQADPDMLREIAIGLKAGAELARIEIPGGELAQLPELIRGHPSPYGFDLVGACFGTIALDAVISGSRIEPGDAVIGIPSSGVHSNGLTLARSAFEDLSERPNELGGATVGETLLEPTTIYVRAVMDLIASDAIDVRGLAHITSGGLLNLLRLEATVGYLIDAPLPRLPIFELIASRIAVEEAELLEVFNLGCGFCCVVPASDVDGALEVISAHHDDAALIGSVTDRCGMVELPSARLSGRKDSGFTAA